MADTMFFHKTALTGGGAGALDLIDGNDRGDGEPLQEGDAAFVTYNGEFYFYLLDEDVGGAESAPALIVPDTNAGDKRWVQQSIPAVGYLAIADIDDTPVNNELDAPISSNWAYEHAADPDAHGAAYVLPTASAATLGGVKVGTRLSIDGAGVLSADDQSSEAYVLPTASPATLGGIKIGTRLSIDGSGVVSADDQAYVLPAASAATLGGVKVASAATLGAVKIGTRLSIDAGGVVSAEDQEYILPTASAATLGGVKVATAATLGAVKIGSNIDIAAGVISVKTGTPSTLGLIKVGSGIDVAAGSISHPTGDGNSHVPANSTTNEGKVLRASAVAGTYAWDQIILYGTGATPATAGLIDGTIFIKYTA
jgi:hypothetical protein